MMMRMRRGAAAAITAGVRGGPDIGICTAANELARATVGAALEVHRTLGPGLLESTYEHCLAQEFALRGIEVQRQCRLPIHYKGVRLDCGYQLDFLVGNLVVVELKAVEILLPIHEAQILSYMRCGKWPLGLLMNFNVTRIKNGIRRFALFSPQPGEENCQESGREGEQSF
jgi:GxxExxY protein